MHHLLLWIGAVVVPEGYRPGISRLQGPLLLWWWCLLPQVMTIHQVGFHFSWVWILGSESWRLMWIWDGGFVWEIGWNLECTLIDWEIGKYMPMWCDVWDFRFGPWRIWILSLEVCPGCELCWEIGWKRLNVNLRERGIRLSCANAMWWVGFQFWLLKNFDDLGSEAMALDVNLSWFFCVCWVWELGWRLNFIVKDWEMRIS